MEPIIGWWFMVVAVVIFGVIRGFQFGKIPHKEWAALENENRPLSQYTSLLFYLGAFMFMPAFMEANVGTSAFWYGVGVIVAEGLVSIGAAILLALVFKGLTRFADWYSTS